MIRLLRQERGIALPMVAAIIAIITILGLSSTYLVDSQGTMGAQYAGGERALYFAEAGVYKYLWHLNKDSRYYAKPEDEKTEDEARLGVDTPFQDGYYRLEVDPPSTEIPVVTIRCTGWAASSPANRRTIEVKAHKRQFVQQIYGSNGEETARGEPVWWITGDEVWGPLHTNGTLNIDGDPRFHGRVTYSVALNVRPGSNPYYEAGPPEKVNTLGFPPSNSQLMLQAKYNGYYYEGRTSILLDGSQVKIWNNGVTQTRPLPANGVIYVNGRTGSDKWGLDMGNAFVSGTLDGRLTIAAVNDIYITAKDPTNLNYDSARVTGGILYANPDFDPPGGITDDMLGLVANRYVRILHYGWFGSYPSHRDVAPQNITIHAAIFALNWSYEFESYDTGSLKGVITLCGSTTQKYRGAVGTFDSWSGERLTGYNKHYTYDPRMLYDMPPHFLEPVNAGWEIVTWREIPSP
ncbi:MAG TPA: hypothetical protein GX513_04890 [Firmicutes bacterium]|nr:hypothetical protein [Bacillota bacterium]